MNEWPKPKMETESSKQEDEGQVTESKIVEVRDTFLVGAENIPAYDIVAEDGFTVTVRKEKGPRPNVGDLMRKEKSDKNGGLFNKSIKINGVEYL